MPVGAVSALILSLIFGPETALGAGIGTMFLSFGNAFMFGGLLTTIPGRLNRLIGYRVPDMDFRAKKRRAIHTHRFIFNMHYQ